MLYRAESYGALLTTYEGFSDSWCGHRTRNSFAKESVHKVKCLELRLTIRKPCPIKALDHRSGKIS